MACVALGPADAAAGQERTPTPSAKELWEAYPLHARPEPAEAAPAPSPAEGRRVSAPAAAPAGGEDPVLPLLAGAVLAIGATATLWTFRPGRARRSAAREQGADERPDQIVPRPPAAEQPAPPPLLKPAAARRPDAPSAPAAVPTPRGLPPDPRATWSAEVRWVRERFAALARTGEQADATVVAESAPLEWPPTGPAAVQALSEAVDELERTLLAAGWAALPAGSEWYAKRFAWKPAAQEREPEVSGRFRRGPAWPEGSDKLWRCELRWVPGLVNSRFEAVVYGPGEREGRVVGGSATFKWLMRADPDPAAQEYQTEVRRLAAALQATGWKLVGRSTKWYSGRFVWRRPGTPPDHVEPQPQLVGQGRRDPA